MCDKMSSPIQIGIVAESRSAVNPTDEEGPLVALNDFRRIKMFTLQPLRFAVTRKLSSDTAYHTVSSGCPEYVRNIFRSVR